jgi:hypothetical protein
MLFIAFCQKWKSNWSMLWTGKIIKAQESFAILCKVINKGEGNQK